MKYTFEACGLERNDIVVNSPSSLLCFAFHTNSNSALKNVQNHHIACIPCHFFANFVIYYFIAVMQKSVVKTTALTLFKDVEEKKFVFLIEINFLRSDVSLSATESL